MRRIAAALSVALAAGLLAGCARGLDARVAKLEAQNAQLAEKVDALSADVRALTQRVVASPPLARRPEGPPPGFGPGPGPRHPDGPPGPPDWAPFGGPPRGRRP